MILCFCLDREAYNFISAYLHSFALYRENQFYLKSLFHNGLPFNAGMATFGSGLNGGVYKQRRGPDADALPPPWNALGTVTLRP